MILCSVNKLLIYKNNAYDQNLSNSTAHSVLSFETVYHSVAVHSSTVVYACIRTVS